MAHDRNFQSQQGRPNRSRPGLVGDSQSNPAPTQYGQGNAARDDVPRSHHISSATPYPPGEVGYGYPSHTTGYPVSGHQTPVYPYSTPSHERSVNAPPSSPIGLTTPGNYYIAPSQQGHNSPLARPNVPASTHNMRQTVTQDTYRNFQSHQPPVPIPTTPGIESLTNNVSRLTMAGHPTSDLANLQGFFSRNAPSISDNTRSYQDPRPQTTGYNPNDRSRPSISQTIPTAPPAGRRSVEAPATPGSNADALPMRPVYNIAGDERNDKTTLDPNYKILHRDFFKVGTVFAILWHENQGAKGRKGTLVTKGIYGEPIYSSIRRMVIVKASNHCAWCLPVTTYSGKGVAKHDVDASKHAVIHMRGTPPKFGANEPEMTKKPIEVDPARPDRTLDPMSRLNFGKVYTVEHNVKVLPVGMISPSSMVRFMSYARGEFKLD